MGHYPLDIMYISLLISQFGLRPDLSVQMQGAEQVDMGSHLIYLSTFLNGIVIKSKPDLSNLPTYHFLILFFSFNIYLSFSFSVDKYRTRGQNATAFISL